MDGNTGMTDYQFQQYEKLLDERDALKKELELLKDPRNFKPGETGMTDMQLKLLLASIYESVKGMFERGSSPDEILAFVASMRDMK